MERRKLIIKDPGFSVFAAITQPAASSMERGLKDGLPRLKTVFWLSGQIPVTHLTDLVL